MAEKKMLVGMEAITSYCGRSKGSIKKLVESDNFPAVKVLGRWESNSELIEVWQRNLVAKNCDEERVLEVQV